MALGDLVPWPKGADLYEFGEQRGQVNAYPPMIAESVVAAACEHVAEIQRRSFADPIPKTVRLAILIQANRWVKRPASPEGVAGLGPDGGAIRLARLDPDVMELLAPDQNIALKAS